MNFNISYTLLSCYKSCRKKCYLQYIKKVIHPDQVNQRPFIVGIVADWLFGKWVEGGYPPGWMEYKADGMFDWFSTKRKIIYRNTDDKDKMKAKLRRAVHDLEVCASDADLQSKRFETQRKVAFEKDGFSFFGKLDMWFPDERKIWDLKITENKKYLDPFQLHFFAWLIENSTPHQVQGLAFFSPLMRPYFREVDWTEVEKHQLESDLYGLLDMIKNETTWDKTAKDCWGCPVQSWCEIEGEKVSEGKLMDGTLIFNLRDTEAESGSKLETDI